MGSFLGFKAHDVGEVEVVPDAATQPGRRVWGLQVHPFEERLYYGVWWETYLGTEVSCNVTSASNEIWSVALDPSTGLPDATTTRLEFLLPDFLGSGRSSPPADIAFSSSGKMLVAERSMQSDSALCSYTHIGYADFDGDPNTSHPVSYSDIITIVDNI